MHSVSHTDDDGAALCVSSFFVCVCVTSHPPFLGSMAWKTHGCYGGAVTNVCANELVTPHTHVESASQHPGDCETQSLTHNPPHM